MRDLVLADRVIARLMPWLQRLDEPPKPREQNNLYGPGEDLSERSDYAWAFKHSAYTRAMMHPKTTRSLLVAAGLVAVGALAARERQRRRLLLRRRSPLRRLLGQ